MKSLFLGILLGLIAFSQILSMRSCSGKPDTAPVIYWVTDPNPARIEQIRIFRSWLKKNHYPDIDVRVDSANAGVQKFMVQGVAGIAGDIVDVSGSMIGILAQMGIIENLAPIFKEFDQPLYDSYFGNRHEMIIGDKVFGTPCNAWPSQYIVNTGIFKKYGLPIPPRRWDFETFEKTGKEFIARANSGKKRQEVWFAYQLNREALTRSLGIAKFNETLTGPFSDWQKNIPVFRLIHKWTFTDHLIPSESEKSSLVADQGYSGGDFQFVNKGVVAMTSAGRHALIQFRLMNPPVEWSVSEQPHGGYPNTTTGTRSLVMYAGGKNKHLAKYFFIFLRSEEYNLQIVRDGDSMPPVPRFILSSDFNRPARFTNEWKVHEAFADAATHLAIGLEVSPFLPSTAKSDKILAFNAYMSGIGTAESAAKDQHDGLQEMIERTVSRSESLRDSFNKAVAVQKRIDEMKKRNEKIPASLIANHFLKKYYLDTGKAFLDLGSSGNLL